MKNNCAIQYAKNHDYGFGQRVDMVCDKSNLTLDEAKLLWNKYYSDLAKHIKNGGTGEMCLWVDMEHDSDYKKSSQWISTDAESDGETIWETKRNYFFIYDVHQNGINQGENPERSVATEDDSSKEAGNQKH